MSSWSMETYLANKKPVMEELIRRHQPRFLIANHCALQISVMYPHVKDRCHLRLLDEDAHALKTNFVPHWGAIYVIGKSFHLKVQAAPSQFEILVSGTYVLEADAPVTINGRNFKPGARIRLNQGAHTIAAAGRAGEATLRLGIDLHRPDHVPSTQRIYTKF